MPSLNSALNLGHGALSAQQRSIATAGHNVANLQTEGYSRQQVDHVAERPQSDGSGGGVRSDKVQRVLDRFTEKKIVQEHSNSSIYSARENFLHKMEIIFNEMEGAGLRNALNDFWNAWSLLSNQPESDAARAEVRDKSDTLSTRFRSMHNELKTIRNEANARVNGVVSEINSIAREIAKLNDQIAQFEAHGSSANDQRDERTRLLEKLSGYVNLSWHENQYGQIGISIGEGWTLVNTTSVYPLKASLSGGEIGMYTIEGMGANEYTTDLTNSFKAGELNETLKIRDQTIVGYMEQLDDLAFGLAHKVNRLHATGTGLNSGSDTLKGSFGLNPEAQDQPLPFLKDGVLQMHLMNPDDHSILETYEIEIQAGVDTIHDIVQRINTTVQDPQLMNASLEPDGSLMLHAGMGNQILLGNDSTDLTLIMGMNNFFETLNGASDMRLSDDIMKDPNKISTGKDMVPGDNQVALDIAKLQTRTTMKNDTMTFDEFYNGTLTEVGLAIQQNQVNKEHQDNLLDQYLQIRDSISGVNLDEEVAKMVQYQKAYEASAKFISTVNEMMDTVIKM